MTVHSTIATQPRSRRAWVVAGTAVASAVAVAAVVAWLAVGRGSGSAPAAKGASSLDARPVPSMMSLTRTRRRQRRVPVANLERPEDAELDVAHSDRVLAVTSSRRLAPHTRALRTRGSRSRAARRR